MEGGIVIVISFILFLSLCSVIPKYGLLCSKCKLGDSSNDNTSARIYHDCKNCVPDILQVNIANNNTSITILDVLTMSNIGNVTKFWKSTGFCPPQPHQSASNWFLSDDMQFNLAYVGAIPFDGITQVRTHWLLDCVKVTSFRNNFPVYDFSELDDVIGSLYQNGLKPGFEVMGNPSNIYNDFENKTQVYRWKMFIQELSQRYIDMYGIEYVSSWNFETWNEPKLKHFDGLNITLQGFYNYYDATYSALKSVRDSLIFGGPGGECHDFNMESYCWGLLNHVVNGINYFTGKVGTGIDYISIHKKGMEPNNTDVIFEKEDEFFSLLNQHVPELSNVSIYNDEGDPLVSWSKSKWWRADATYAANVVKRTLLARFQMNNTEPHHVQFIRKPVYSAMGLLSYLGETQLAVKVGNPNKNIGVLATSHTETDIEKPQDSYQVAVLMYNSADTHNISTENLVKMKLNNLVSAYEYRYVVYQLDNTNGNPYQDWLNAGSPKTPNRNTFAKMRENEEPKVYGPKNLPLSSTFLEVDINLPLPGVALVHLCAKSKFPPGQVVQLQVFNITTGQVLIVWSDSLIGTKCIKTYEIEFLSTVVRNNSFNQNKFRRINKRDTVFNLFVSVSGNNRGSYRARAVDYWNRPGEYSNIVHYPT